MFVLKHIIKTKIKNDKNSEKLSGNMGKDLFSLQRILLIPY